MTKVTQNITYLIQFINYLFLTVLIVEIEENEQAAMSFYARCTQINALINIICIIMQIGITVIDIDPEYKIHHMIQCLSDYK